MKRLNETTDPEDGIGTGWERTLKIEDDVLYFSDYRDHMPIESTAHSYMKIID